MKYIDRFKNFLSKDRKDIYDWCVDNSLCFDIKNGLINAEVAYINKKMKELPYKFGKVTTFACSMIDLESAKNFPVECVDLSCSYNKLKSLEGIGKVSFRLNCSNNKLKSLKGLDKDSSIENLDCSNNLLTSLKGLPKILDRLDCSYNRITSINIENIDDIDINFYQNPIHELCSYIFKFYGIEFSRARRVSDAQGHVRAMNKKHLEILKLLNEYNVVRGNKIMLEYLMEVLYMINTDYKKVMDKPRASLEDLYKIEGYEIIE